MVRDRNLCNFLLEFIVCSWVKNEKKIGGSKVVVTPPEKSSYAIDMYSVHCLPFQCYSVWCFSSATIHIYFYLLFVFWRCKTNSSPIQATKRKRFDVEFFIMAQNLYLPIFSLLFLLLVSILTFSRSATKYKASFADANNVNEFNAFFYKN